jgi:hypothetical protein
MKHEALTHKIIRRLNGLKDNRIYPESKAIQILQSSNPKNPNSGNGRAG